MSDRLREFWLKIYQGLNPASYREIAFQPLIASFSYLAVLLGIVSLSLSVKQAVILKRVSVEIANWATVNLPHILPESLQEIRIENGEVSSLAEQPYIYKKENFAFILDTTGRITSLAGYRNGLLLTKNKLIYKLTQRAKAEIREYDLSRVSFLSLRPGDKEVGEIVNLTLEDKSFSLTAERINRWSKIFPLLAFPFIAVGIFIYQIIAKLAQLFLFSLISLLINKTKGAKLKFINLLNIGTFAFTPCALLALLFELSGLEFVYFWIVYVGVYLVFLSKSISYCKVSQGGTKQVFRA